MTTGDPELALPTLAVLAMFTSAPRSAMLAPYKPAPAPTLSVPTPSSPEPSASTSAARLERGRAGVDRGVAADRDVTGGLKRDWSVGVADIAAHGQRGIRSGGHQAECAAVEREAGAGVDDDVAVDQSAVRADVPENVEVPEKLSSGVEAPEDDWRKGDE